MDSFLVVLNFAALGVLLVAALPAVVEGFRHGRRGDTTLRNELRALRADLQDLRKQVAEERAPDPRQLELPL